jgi:hypothetical protein
MAESTVPNNEKDVQDLNNKKLFLHLIKPDFISVGSEYESVTNIDTIPDNSCNEIIINDLLDYLSYNESTNILDLLINKLCTNGSIIIQSVDLYQLATAVTFNDIDLDTTKIVLYQNKKAIYTLYDIESELKNRKLNIVEKKYINIFEYYIKATK